MEPIVPKKRGRPLGVKNKSKLTEVSKTVVKAPVVEPQQPRKRGRPRKVTPGISGVSSSQQSSIQSS